MKHFIGGFALGFVVAIIRLPKTDKGGYLIPFLAQVFIAFLFGMMAWGLLP